MPESDEERAERQSGSARRLMNDMSASVSRSRSGVSERMLQIRRS